MSRTELDLLDERYRTLQDELGAAIERDDTAAADEARIESISLSVADVDDMRWYVHTPGASALAKPFHRFHYRYQRGREGEQLRPVSRSRFASTPSLARSYGERHGTTGFMAFIVRNIEPLGYVGGGAVGAGLWFLLGDLIGSLPSWAVFAGLMLLAAGLWLSASRLKSTRYREAGRLAQVTTAAAVGVTASLPWVATIDASWITGPGRVAVTAYVLTAAAALAFVKRGSFLTYSFGLGGWIVALGATSKILLDEAFPSSFDELSFQPGVLIALAVIFPVATMVASPRWIPASVLASAIIGTFVIVVAASDEASTTEGMIAVALGASAGVSCMTSRKMLRSSMRSFHVWSAVALFGASAIVLLVKAPWDILETLADWLSNVPIPVWLVTGGSILLIVVAWVIRRAVSRMAQGDDDSGTAAD